MAALQRCLCPLRGEVILNSVAQTPEIAFKQKERQAWTILLTAFCVTVVLTIVVPYAARLYYLHATVAREGALEVVSGTVRMARPGASADIAANNGDPVLEGFTIKTDSTSRALITLFDGSTVYVFEDSELFVKTLRLSRFTKHLTSIVLQERAGRLRIGVAPPTTGDLLFLVETPHASVDLEDGSYSIEVGSQGTDVRVRAGLARVTALRSEVNVKRGQRTTVSPGQTPAPPGPAALDLVVNGDFRQGDQGWTIKNEVEAGRQEDIVGQTLFVGEPPNMLVRFVRRGSKNSHGENGIYQTINRDVSDFISLKLSLDFKLIYQSLSGGGYLGSEYPILVQVTYRDATGAQVTWARGFYYHNEAGYPTTYGEQVPSDVWLPYEKDLLALEGYPKPFRLLSVGVVASGWDYESMISSVSIVAE